ncbi:MAG TPA: beta-ketoacyl synthase chain length factor [Steroidobacteraceae bacterium]|nr:beta-ketoacyl synthase chain length factor [Steroidobacteraceae bacterium]
MSPGMDPAAVPATPRTVYVEGVGLWAPRLPGWEHGRAVLRGEAPPAQPAARPAPAILPATERRRAPDSVALALEVAQAACAHAHRDPAQLASVFASTHGDLAITDYMCATLAQTPAMISPTKFHHSVHNAAAGYWSIAAGCLAPYTALSAFEYTFAEGLLAAMVQACTGHEAVLLVAYDIEARGPLATVAHSRGMLGAALVLAAAPGPRSIARLQFQTGQGTGMDSRGRPANAALVQGNAMSACLPLLEALADERPRSLRHALGPALALAVELEPLDPPAG